MRDGAPAQLKGAKVGGIATATAQAESMGGFRYCAVEATFTPPTPEPNAYLIKFSDRDWDNGAGARQGPIRLVFSQLPSVPKPDRPA